jgi:hypothetical protein
MKAGAKGGLRQGRIEARTAMDSSSNHPPWRQVGTILRVPPGYAREAISDRTPFFASYDAAGHTIRGKFDPGFENWCALNDKDPKAVAAIQISSQPEDVLTLAAVNDARPRVLLRNGLESPNALIFAYSVQGLGRLQDWDAVALIEKASRRLPYACDAIALVRIA